MRTLEKAESQKHQVPAKNALFISVFALLASRLPCHCYRKPLLPGRRTLPVFMRGRVRAHAVACAGFSGHSSDGYLDATSTCKGY